MLAFACCSLKRGKEAASCVPAFQVGMPKSGQARLYVICARALQSRVYMCEQSRGGRWSDGIGGGGAESRGLKGIFW